MEKVNLGFPLFSPHLEVKARAPPRPLVPFVLHFLLVSLTDSILLLCPQQPTTPHSYSMQENKLEFEK